MAYNPNPSIKMIKKRKSKKRKSKRKSKTLMIHLYHHGICMSVCLIKKLIKNVKKIKQINIKKITIETDTLRDMLAYMIIVKIN